MIDVKYHEKYVSADKCANQLVGMYLVQSELWRGAIYGFKDDEFVFSNSDFIATCKQDEIMQFVEEYAPGVKAEVTDICNMVDELRYTYRRAI